MSAILDLHYELPEELVAQQPAPHRGESQLLVVGAHDTDIQTVGTFSTTLLDQLRPDDLVVANDTRVLHARVSVVRETGGQGELLLLEPDPNSIDPQVWIAMARPARRFRAGTSVACTADPQQHIELIGRRADGLWTVRLPVATSIVPRWLEQVGQVPLPPYIRPSDQPADRYQTVYSAEAGSVAAPTAGLHFDETLWANVRDYCEVALVTLHVGAGTFLPVRGPLEEHVMHDERYEVNASTDAVIRAAMRDGRRIVAVGTTTTRVLESVYGSAAQPTMGRTSLFITPGFSFECVGAMVTNFHLPGSTLLALVMAFGGSDTIRAAYREAVEQRLRFYSFGDAMFIHGES